MTARMLVDAARTAYGEEPEFEHNTHFGDEKMIERRIRMGRFSNMSVPEDKIIKDEVEKDSKL